MLSNIDEQLKEAGLYMPPAPAGYHVKRFFDKKGLNASQASKVLLVNQSTVSRFLSGGGLSIDMAKRLKKHYNLPIKMLFNMEAAHQAHKAEQEIELELALKKEV